MTVTLLVASERSGSNLLAKMMDAHSRVCGPSPKHILNVLSEAGRYLHPLDESGNWKALIELLLDLLDSRFATWSTKFDLAMLDRMAPPGDMRSLLQGIYAAEAAVHEKEDLFLKEITPYRYMSFINYVFPACRFVYLVRDPRDMALSWRENRAHPGGVVAGALQWQHDQSATLAHYTAMLQEDRVLGVRYEDLVTDPECELRRISEFMRIEYEDGMLAYHEKELTINNAESNPAWRNLARSVMSDNIGKFRSRLTGSELTAVEAICASLMPAFNYIPESDRAARAQLTAHEINSLYMQELRQFPASTSDLEPMTHDIVRARLRARPLTRLF
jgi:hypothetical protein